jgi:dUTP pyrophosphatase
MKSVVIQLFKLAEEVPTPAYGTTMAACFDLSFQPTGRFSIQGYDEWNRPVDRMTYSDTVDIYPGDRLLVPTGLIMKIRALHMEEDYLLSNYSIRLHARSGMSLKKGLVLANAEGVIDVDYQKEIFVMLTNISQIPVSIEKGERIAQAEVVQQCGAYFELVKDQPVGYSERDGGFGSTGHN